MNELCTAITLAVQADVPVVLVGTPGLAKSALAKLVAKWLSMFYEASYPTRMDETDIGGLYINTGKRNRAGDLLLERSLPDFASRLMEASPQLAMWFIDELNNADPMTQAHFMTAIQEKIVAGRYLGDNVRIVLAMNPSSSNATGNALVGPLTNRMLHLNVEPVEIHKGFKNYKLGFEPPPVRMLSAGWNSVNKMATINTNHAAFATVSPENVYAHPTDFSKREEPYPTFRSWGEWATRIEAACDDMKVSDEIFHRLMSGLVGPGAATAYMAFRDFRDLPDPKAALANPSRWETPNRRDRQIAALMALISAVRQDHKPKNFAAAWSILVRTGNVAGPAISAVPAESLMRIERQQFPDAVPPDAAVKMFYSIFSAAGLIR